MPVSFSGGQSLPAPGTGAYTAAQQGSGQGFYNPSTGNLTSSQGGVLYSPSSGGPSSATSFQSTGSQSAPPPIPTTTNASSLATMPTALTIPGQKQSTSPTAFVSSLAPVNPNAPGSGFDTNGSNPGQPSDWRNAFMSSYLGLTQQAGQEGAAYNQAAEQYQIPELNQSLANIRGTIAQRTAAYMAQWNQANAEHAAMPYIAGEQTQIQRTQAIEIGMLTAQEQALSGNLQAANDIVNQTIQHEFEPIKTQLSAMQSFYQMNQNDLTDSEKAQLQQNYALQQTNYQNFLQTKSDAYNTAIQYGASPQVLSSLANAQNQTDVWNALTGVVSGTSNTGGNIVNGYDLSTYATDPSYASKIAATSTAIGTVTSVAQADKIISSIAPNSPITGQMIANAASQYNVDPNTLMSVLGVESKFGTLGVGAKTNNPGNVGNTDSGATQKFSSWQEGVNAAAQQLANRKVSVNQAVQGNTDSNYQSQVTNSAPMLIRASVRFFDGNTAYIDSSTLTDAQSQTMAKSYSARSGIPILNAQDAEAVRGLETAKANLDTVASKFFEVAPGVSNSGVGNFLSKMYFKLSAPVNKFFDTNYGAELSAFQNNRESLIKQVNSLAGSSPRLNTNELDLAANAMPTLNEFNTNTIKDGEAKLAITYNYFDNAIKTFLPNYQPTPPMTYQSYIQQQNGVTQNTPSAQTQGNVVKAPDGKMIQIID